MKRKSESGPASTKKVAKKDLVTEALEKFRSGMTSSVPQEFPIESKIKEVAELEKKKVIEEFIPIIVRSTSQEVYDNVLELETGIQKIIQEFWDKMKAPESVDAQDTIVQGDREGSTPEVVSTIYVTIVKTATECPEHEDNMNGRISVVQVGEDAKQKLEKLESYILDFSKDIRYHKNGWAGRVPVIAKWPERWRPVKRSELRNNIQNMKPFLQSGEFWADEYRPIHGKLMKVGKFASNALTNALTRPRNPLFLIDEDCLIWCLASDLDIRESLPSEKESLEFKKEKMEFELNFFKLLFGYLIDAQWIDHEWKRDKDSCTRWLLEMVKSQIVSVLPEMDERPGPDMLRTEALSHLWKLRKNPEDKNKSSSELESSQSSADTDPK